MTGSLSFHSVPTPGRRDHLTPVGRSSDPGQDKGKERRFSNGEINRELTTLKRIFNGAAERQAHARAAYPDAQGAERTDRILRA